MRSLSNYYPYGMQIGAGSWSGGDYNYGYNGMLKEGIGKDIYHTLNRALFTEVPVWIKTDPLEFQFPWRSPYISMGNNPISRVDPNGDADYYKKDGEHLGNDGEDDDRTMQATGIKEDEDGNITFEYPIDLKVSHQKFLKHSAIVYGESTNRNEFDNETHKKEKFGIASAIYNYSEKDRRKVDGTYSYAIGEDLYNDFLNSNSDKRNNNKFMKMSISASINAYSGGFDYSNGARFWDGPDVITGLTTGYHPEKHYRNKNHKNKYVNNYGGIYDPKGFSNAFYINSAIYLSKSAPKDYKKMDDMNILNKGDRWLWETTGTQGAALFYIQRKDTK